jgi:predicted amino acid racemase
MAILNLNVPKIVDNFNKIKSLCEDRKQEFVAVTKLCQSDPVIVASLRNAGAEIIADSHL